ncbi:MAG: glycerol-3-phosphate acyltransferase [Candidatus Nanopelagicales bacterium]
MTAWLVIPAAAVVGFAVGSTSPATWLARRRGVELATSGSGNPGATNVGRVLGRRFGVIVGLVDVLKGLLPTLAFLPFGETPALVAGTAAVLGHCYSPWLKGHGGKGVATSLGAILGVAPLFALLVVLVFAVVVVMTRWVALASVSAALFIIVAASFAAVSNEDSVSVGQIVSAFVIGVVVIARHRSNLTAKLRGH